MNQIRGFHKEISLAKLRGKDQFFTWFNSAKDTNDAFVRGEWDFAVHIASPIARYIKNPETKTILEIGHGGGRLLAAASKYFRKAVGVDIHAENSFVRRELIDRGVENIRLLEGNGSHIPLPESAVDAVYSFIVLQHVQKIEIFQKYFKEAFRVLKPGGTAILYFGRYCRFSRGRQSLWLFLLDNLLDIILLRGGYQEKPSQVNDINLIVSKIHAQNLALGLGFIVNDFVVSKSHVPDGIDTYGSQWGIILTKPL